LAIGLIKTTIIGDQAPDAVKACSGQMNKRGHNSPSESGGASSMIPRHIGSGGVFKLNPQNGGWRRWRAFSGSRKVSFARMEIKQDDIGYD